MKRDIYKQLISWKHSSSRKPLVLKGERQVGKTYILKYFWKKASEYPIATADSLLGVKIGQSVSFSVGKVNSLDMDPISFDAFLEKLSSLCSFAVFKGFLKKCVRCCGIVLCGYKIFMEH